MKQSRQVFFRPASRVTKSSRLNAAVYNRYRLLLKRLAKAFVFVPLRPMQFLAIVTNDEILFIDSNGSYHSHGEEAGRCISYAWRFPSSLTRTALDKPIRYTQIRYCVENTADEARLIPEFTTAVNTQFNKILGEKYQNSHCKIIPLKQ